MRNIRNSALYLYTYNCLQHSQNENNIKYQRNICCRFKNKAKQYVGKRALKDATFQIYKTTTLYSYCVNIATLSMESVTLSYSALVF